MLAIFLVTTPIGDRFRNNYKVCRSDLSLWIILFISRKWCRDRIRFPPLLSEQINAVPTSLLVTVCLFQSFAQKLNIFTNSTSLMKCATFSKMLPRMQKSFRKIWPPLPTKEVLQKSPQKFSPPAKKSPFSPSDFTPFLRVKAGINSWQF